MLALGRQMEMDDPVARALGFWPGPTPLTGYDPAWRQLTAATTTPTHCSIAMIRYGVSSS
jgi:hypothetical protein